MICIFLINIYICLVDCYKMGYLLIYLLILCFIELEKNDILCGNFVLFC